MNVKRQKINDPLENLVGSEGVENLEQIRVLVVGAGGLGCEIVKNMAVSGFRHIDVIDMDTIELTNLNRQFLFGEDDIGKPKAEVAACKVQSFLDFSRIPAIVTPHINRIEHMPDSFYERFHIVICGLDSIRARRWINAKLVGLCFSDPSPSGLRPLIDGGSEGFRGQSRVILPGITPCYECTLDLVLTGNAASYPLCTIASIPRLPEHCIEWAKTVRWSQVFKHDPDFDNEDDMQWLFEESKSRAAEFNIDGVNLELVYGVLKRIIPAVASTNAVIAASCSLEALKLATGLQDPVNNYFMYTGDTGVFSSVFEFEKRDSCPVCGSHALDLTVSDPSQTLEYTLIQLQSALNCSKSVLPSISTANGKTLFMASPPNLREKLEPNLHKSLKALLAQEESTAELAVTHPDLPFAVRVSLNFLI